MKLITVFAAAVTCVSAADFSQMPPELVAEGLIVSLVEAATKHVSEHDPVRIAFEEKSTRFKNGSITKDDLITTFMDDFADLAGRYRRDVLKGLTFSDEFSKIWEIPKIQQILPALEKAFAQYTDLGTNPGRLLDDIIDKNKELRVSLDTVLTQVPKIVNCKLYFFVMEALLLQGAADGVISRGKVVKKDTTWPSDPVKSDPVESDSEGLGTLGIVGIVGGVLMGLVLIGGLIYYFYWVPKKRATFT